MTAQSFADRLELAAIAMERTQLSMVVTNPREPDNPIVLANQAFLDLTGYGAEEVLGRNPRFMQGPGTSPLVVADIRAAVAEGRDFTLEVLNYRKSGDPFWNQLHASAIHDEAGQLLYYFASQQDVTAFRKVQILEATEHRLLREVDHRARNVLAVVNGIVRLSRSDDPKLYAAAIQQRVQVLADAHTLLSDRGWRDVEMETLVGQQVTPGPRIRISAPEPSVMVPPLAVQPLALALHELWFNAQIHGALSQLGGRVDISWAPEPASGGFALTWAETTATALSERGPDGFGSMMIRSMVERQLQGHVRRDWASHGVCVVLRIPEAAAPLAAPSIR